MAQKFNNIAKFKLSRISPPRTWKTGIPICIVILTFRYTLIFHETRRYIFNRSQLGDCIEDIEKQTAFNLTKMSLGRVM